MARQTREQWQAEEWVRAHDLPVFFVYGLKDKNGQVLYVGATKDMYKRLRAHKLGDLVEGRFGGELETPVILDAGLTEEEAYAREQSRYDELQPTQQQRRPSGKPPAGTLSSRRRGGAPRRDSSPLLLHSPGPI